MAKVRVTIIDPHGDKSFNVELPDDAMMNALVPQLLPVLGLNQQGSFTLQHKRTERILAPTETLSSAGVQNDDTLRIVQAPSAALLNRLKDFEV